MNEPTATDMELLLKEENIQTLTHVFTPLIQDAVNAAIPAELMQLVNELRQARDELATARSELKEAATRYVTVEESERAVQQFAAQIREPLAKSIDTHLSELKEEDRLRNQAFDQRIGEINALVLTHDQELTTLKALNEAQMSDIKSRLTKVETDIQTGVAAVAKNSATMNRAVGQWITESKRKDEKIDLELKRHDNAIVQFEKQIRDNRDDTGNLRGDVEGLRGDISATVHPLRDKVNALVPRVDSLTARQDAADLVLRYVEIIGNALTSLVRTRKGNVALAVIVFLLFGFQIINAFLTYQFIQRFPN